MTSHEINRFIKRYWRRYPDKELANKLGISRNAVEHRRNRMGLDRLTTHATPKQAIKYETDHDRQQQERANHKRQIKYLLGEVERLQRERDAALSLKKSLTPRPIRKTRSLGGEATIVALASDWHCEERVRHGEVNGLNEHNLEISAARATSYFATLLRLVNIEQQNTRIDHLVLALLGDFITGDIHEEMVETALLEPTLATRKAQELLVSGIDYLLANSQLQLTIPCHSGNHGRTTKDQRHATENGHSLEWLLYHMLADRYAGNNRVHITIPESYHSYQPIYQWMVRFHHGHSINYGGGVGGITIPIRKAIAQWNTLKKADIDCFGHFHQALDGGNFIANGSMIGYNAYALSIKAAYEEPVQMLFGIHSRLGKFVTRPIKFIS